MWDSSHTHTHHTINQIGNCIDIVHFGAHTPHSFVFPQSTQKWGKMPLHIKGMSLLISTSPCASLSDVGFHELQDSLLGHYKFPSK